MTPARTAFEAEIVAQTNGWAQRMMGGWRGAPEVKIVSNTERLPVSVPDDVRGLFGPTGVWLVAENLYTADLTAQTLRHELTHYNFRQMMDRAGLRGFMSSLAKGVDQSKGDLAQVRGWVRRAYVDESGRFELNRLLEAEEIACFVSERLTCPETGALLVNKAARKMAAAAANSFLRERLHLDIPVTEDELQGVLAASEHRLKHGGPCWGMVSRVRDWYAERMSKPWHQEPVRSHDELKRMLAAEDERTKGIADFKAMCMIALGLLGLVAMVGGFGYWAYMAISAAGKLLG